MNYGIFQEKTLICVPSPPKSVCEIKIPGVLQSSNPVRLDVGLPGLYILLWNIVK